LVNVCFLWCCRGRSESLGDLLASVRRQGVRGDSLLKDGDNLLQRYRNLETRLQDQHAQAQKALDHQREDFHSRAESTQAWIGDLAQGLVSARVQARHQEVKQAAQVGDGSQEGSHSWVVVHTAGSVVQRSVHILMGMFWSSRGRLSWTPSPTETIKWRT